MKQNLPSARLNAAMTDIRRRFCIRCTYDMKGKEKYFLLGGYYCRACIATIKNDRSWPITKNQLLALASLKQIEI